MPASLTRSTSLAVFRLQPSRRAGFTLLEVVVAVAIVAVMAGAITPLVFQQLMEAKTEATRNELAAIETGLQRFYADTGRFPRESEGLAALVGDPGLESWQGPYVATGQSDPVLAVARDAFDSPYIYDLDPQTSATAQADLIVASPGANLSYECGTLNESWRLDAGDDDLVLLVSRAALDRAARLAAGVELEAIASAARAYFAAEAVFPGDVDQLLGNYLDPGLDGTAARDPWYQPYLLTPTTDQPPQLIITSRGPDRRDDRGGGDDLVLQLSSAAVGRHSTTYKLTIAQTILNNNPSLELAAAWPGPSGARAALGLATAFDRDGWGNSYGLNVASRTVFSAGPDGRAEHVADNIPPGVGP